MKISEKLQDEILIEILNDIEDLKKRSNLETNEKIKILLRGKLFGLNSIHSLINSWNFQNYGKII